jgi:hypothetical protein
MLISHNNIQNKNYKKALYDYCVQSTNNSMKKYENQERNNSLVITDRMSIPNYNIILPICVFLSSSYLIYYFYK